MSTAQVKVDAAIAEAAAEWVVTLQNAAVSPEQRTGFLKWMRQSPAHVQGYIDAEITFLALQEVVRDDATDARTLLVAGAANVTPFEPHLARKPRARFNSNHARHWLKPVSALAATIALAALCTVHFDLIERLDPHTYRTAIGEQRRIKLEDGSIIELNTASKLRASFDGAQRTLHLIEGEAFFVVAKDAKRPFRVLSGSATVRALGTEFDVYRGASHTSVTVVEGRVAVDTSNVASEGAQGEPAARPDDSSHVEVGAGDGVNVSPSNRIQRVATNPRVITAWRQQRLIFENENVAAVAEQFNRYNKRRIVIRDTALAQEQINGVFDADKPEYFVDFLTHDGRVKADINRPDEFILSR